MPPYITVGRVLALAAGILALIAVLGIGTTVPLIPIALLILAAGVIVG